MARENQGVLKQVAAAEASIAAAERDVQQVRVAGPRVAVRAAVQLAVLLLLCDTPEFQVCACVRVCPQVSAALEEAAAVRKGLEQQAKAAAQAVREAQAALKQVAAR